ncbi:ABR186Wp [Eremothecium gossypii ATCC 10895]|uniref:3-methyl-2-oxobutanoate hydroxymethyltransferase n=1 Tax=Eremothecium gossypii (strain ATCC 10895 / CBS 109.51 / FGSC 9923 / NRRL Y-1056) TaxID=284811 RepID=Q75D37_EREGS|nr:ABR186Wp [Eremothecium gossypii ATCC 10895]AAS50958.1 ABR186Wp [Eremothecium gossypii ATCC 10895]AEY95247.1 FABR186Wp [Eremothecium gossypii FDAG1]
MLASRPIKAMALRRMYSIHSSSKQKTIPDIFKKYHAKEPISMITAYDYITATWAHAAHTDMILVGDSLAMSTLGHVSTVDLDLQEFQYHVRSVCRAPGSSFIIADMPYGSFERSIEQGVETAISLMKTSSRVGAVKLEVGAEENDYCLELAAELCRRGIPVMGHVGLTPQRMHALGGYKVQGAKDLGQALAAYHRAKDLQAAGCFSIVIECIPTKLAGIITEKLSIPTIGIGAGPQTSGQVLVQSDLLGMLPGKAPKFVQKYADFHGDAIGSLCSYVEDVRQGVFPKVGQHTFTVSEELLEEFSKQVD